MRDLSKTKVTRWWTTKSGKRIAEAREGKRGARYICFIVEYPRLDGIPQYGWRDFRDMRITQLTDAARYIGELLERGDVEQNTAELVLDMLYAELNSRLNRAKK